MTSVTTYVMSLVIEYLSEPSLNFNVWKHSSSGSGLFGSSNLQMLKINKIIQNMQINLQNIKNVPILKITKMIGS